MKAQIILIDFLIGILILLSIFVLTNRITEEFSNSNDESSFYLLSDRLVEETRDLSFSMEDYNKIKRHYSGDFCFELFSNNESILSFNCNNLNSPFRSLSRSFFVNNTAYKLVIYTW